MLLKNSYIYIRIKKAQMQTLRRHIELFLGTLPTAMWQNACVYFGSKINSDHKYGDSILSMT